MAYTATPTLSTQQIYRNPVRKNPGDNIGNMINQGEYYLDCIPHTITHYATDPSRVLIKRPHMAVSKTTLHSGATAFRGIKESETVIYTAVAGSFYANGISKGSLHYTSGTVFIERFRYGADDLLIIVECHGSAAYLTEYNVASATLGTPVALGFGTAGPFAVMDGYVFIVATDGQKVYNSTLGDPSTFNTSSDFLETEQFGDAAVYCFTYKNHLCVVGTNSVEFFYDAANELGSPLARQIGYSHRLGCAAMMAFAVQGPTKPFVYLDNDVYILLTNESQQIALHRLRDFDIQVVQEAVELNSQISDGVNYYTNAGGLVLIPIQGRQVIFVQGYNLIYDPEQKVTAKWYFKDANGAIHPLFCYVNGVGTVRSAERRYNATSGWDITTTALAEANYNTSTESPFIAEYHTDVIDMGNRNWKHIRWVDVLGVFNDEQLRLYYTNDPYSGNWTDTGFDYGTADYAETVPHRWHNLGRHRLFRVKLEFSGNDAMQFQGLEIAYNGGSTV